jgi:hypothetical protein
MIRSRTLSDRHVKGRIAVSVRYDEIDILERLGTEESDYMK